MLRSPVGVAIITHQARHHLIHCLTPLLRSALKPRILVVNSSSEDGTVEEAKRLGVETLVIPRHAFNHGATREQARQHLQTDLLVMMTPDAYPTQPDLLERLVAPLEDGRASVSYARQIPHEGTPYLEASLRTFNYPEKSHVRGIEEVALWGVYTFFCSNCCAAYRNSALDQIGGFPTVLTGEDTLVTAQLLRRGHKVAYVAEAIVRHSHCYTLTQEFCRYFDTGYARQQHASLLDFGVTDGQRGRAYLRELLVKLCREKPSLIPYALLRNFVKWAGYQVGRCSVGAPKSFVRRLSSQDFYWDSDACH